MRHVFDSDGAIMQNIVQALLDKGVLIPCPEAVSLDSIHPERIEPGVTLYPGTHLCGEETYIAEGSVIGQGGGAYIENCQIGTRCVLMQGVYRDSTMLNGFNARNGAEVRDHCLLEEEVSLGHTVGLKQTIFMTHVVAGSLINFCDALMCGGRSRKDHSEIGSCMALYNFTPQGDKFASSFGDVVRGVFLDQDSIFIGGQTQLVSPIHVGFGTIIAAGSKLSHSIGDGQFITGSDAPCRERDNQPRIVRRAYDKVESTIQFIAQLYALRGWYEHVRVPALTATSPYSVLLPAAIHHIDKAIAERIKRIRTFRERLCATKTEVDENTLKDYARALDRFDQSFSATWDFEETPRLNKDILNAISNEIRRSMENGTTYPEAVHQLTAVQKSASWVIV